MNTTVSDSPLRCSAGDAEAAVKSVSLFHFPIHVSGLKAYAHPFLNEPRDDKHNSVLYNLVAHKPSDRKERIIRGEAEDRETLKVVSLSSLQLIHLATRGCWFLVQTEISISWLSQNRKQTPNILKVQHDFSHH